MTRRLVTLFLLVAGAVSALASAASAGSLKAPFWP